MNTVSPELAELARFVVETEWRDLPDDVVHEAKLFLLDSIGCGLAGITTEPARMAVDLARRLGGPPESSIIGTGDKVSCANAAFANGQLIIATDHHALMPGMHAPPFIVPPPLAVGESTGASGRNLIVAMVLGFEVAARIESALVPRHYAALGCFDGADGKNFGWPERGGQAYSNLGAAAGAGKLLHLDRDKMSNALGIAAHLCRVLTHVRFTYGAHRPMTKYEVPGWQNTGAITAVLLADMGFMGDTTVFDPDQGFWKFCGYEGWQGEKVTEGIGATWHLLRVSYKPYPCCRTFHTVLDCFLNIIDQNHLMPEDIESVRAFSHPTVELPVFVIRELTNVVDVQFGLPYLFALAAHRVRAGVEWLDLDTVRQPKILDFAKKVSLVAHPKFGEQWLKDPLSHLGKVEVAAGGRIFSEERVYSRGTRGTGLELTDAELVDKFRHNASRVLSQDKIEGAIRTILAIDAVENISDLMKWLTP